MPHSKDQIIKLIDLDEPDYTVIVKQFTQDDVQTLIDLTKEPNVAIATKAISCLGLMNSDKAVAGMEAAAKHSDPVIRVATANALRHSSSLASAVKLVDGLLDDHDLGVRKFALKTVQHGKMRSLRAKVQSLSEKETSEVMKNLSGQVFQSIKQ